MPDQHGFGDYDTESTRPRQSGQGDDQMNEYDSEVAHPGNGINASKTTALRPIWQFAIDRRWSRVQGRRCPGCRRHAGRINAVAQSDRGLSIVS